MIKMMIGDDEALKDPTNIEKLTYDGRVIYLRRSHVGLVLQTGEVNGRDDSDFFAVVWNREKQQPERITYASTRGWTYANSAGVDATPDVLAEVAAHAERARIQRQAELADHEARTPSKGRRVKVVAGRKLPHGTEGEVFWFGKAREFGVYPKNGYMAHGREMHSLAVSLGFLFDPRQDMRVGLLLDDGTKVFLNAMNVEVVS